MWERQPGGGGAGRTVGLLATLIPSRRGDLAEHFSLCSLFWGQ
jgi:hypothetical protein